MGEKKLIDVYYDDSQYSLTRKDIWLRSRDGRFELKAPMNVPIEERVADRYRELETDREILAYLKLPENKTLGDALRDGGYGPFATIAATRKKYRKDGYNIDLDTADFGYQVAEIEYMTDEASSMDGVTRKIMEYAGSHGLSSGDVIYGKVVEFLKRNNPAHFQALRDAKVIQ